MFIYSLSFLVVAILLSQHSSGTVTSAFLVSTTPMVEAEQQNYVQESKGALSAAGCCDDKSYCPCNDTSWVKKVRPLVSISSFGFLNISQFIGAMNDNIFKLLVIFCFIHLEGQEASNKILSLAGACYVLPFIFLSSTAGTLADKYSKRKIIVITRFFELLILSLGLIAFTIPSKFLAITSLILLAAHSAIFGPCKMGIIPEIVPKEGISRANGILTSSTYVAIIVGTFLASFLTEITDRNFVIAAAVAIGFSTIGFLSSLQITPTPPAGSSKNVSPWFFIEVFRTLKIIRREPSLLSAVVGSAFFLFIGSFVQLNMIPFAMKIMGLNDVQGGYLFLLTALGIGIGSLVAGWVSGTTVEFGLVPLGGVGIAICSFLMDYCSEQFGVLVFLIFLLGFFGGLYLVPLDSFIQVASPRTYRGQVVATTNFFGFFGVLCSAAVLYLISEILELPPDRGFTLIGILTVLVVSIISISMSGYIVRFFSFIASYLLFPALLRGKEKIPVDTPSLIFVPHSFSPWSMVLIAAQRRRMRLIMVSSKERSSFIAHRIKRMIPILEVDSLEAISPGEDQEDLIRDAVLRGTSIAIFCSKKTMSEQMQRFVNSWRNQELIKSDNFFEVIVPEAMPTASLLGFRTLVADISPISQSSAS